jgi:hypothetical protein
MRHMKLAWSIVFFMACLVANVGAVSSVAAPQKSMGNDEETFIFAGRCPNGQAYRLFSYQAEVDGLTEFFYDYEGPVGKGTVKTKASPKTLAVRICRVLAEIAND